MSCVLRLAGIETSGEKLLYDSPQPDRLRPGRRKTPPRLSAEIYEHLGTPYERWLKPRKTKRISS